MSEDLLNTIEEYEKEIERLKEDNEYLNKTNIELSTEKNRLNNIINEFEEELKWQRKVCLSLNEAFMVSRIDILINCLRELKKKEVNK